MPNGNALEGRAPSRPLLKSGAKGRIGEIRLTWLVDAGGKVINIAAYTTPMSDQLYPSAGPTKYVVEAKAGFADRFGIRPGHTVRWKRLR